MKGHCLKASEKFSDMREQGNGGGQRARYDLKVRIQPDHGKLS